MIWRFWGMWVAHVIIWNLTAANKKQHMGICSSDAITGMMGGDDGRRWVGARIRGKEGGEMGSGVGYPLVLSSYLGVSLIYEGRVQVLQKSWPQRAEPFDPSSQLLHPATIQTRQVASSAPLLCCYNLSASANSLKQNKHSVFVRSGCALMEGILLSKQQGVCIKDCGKRLFQQQEIRNVSFVGARMFTAWADV